MQGRIFVTGDTHGEISMSRLSKKKWPMGATLTREDFIIVAGDFGLLFYPMPDAAEIWWTEWLKERPFTVLVVDGNHDNHERLARLPEENMFGSVVGKIADNIFHLKRGMVYEIAGKKILTFGGAESIDKAHRREGISWWKEEVPSYGDMDKCIGSITNCENKVDYLIAHTCPTTLASMILSTIGGQKNEDPTCRMLEHIITSCEFRDFYCGHWHVDKDFGKYHFLYDRIVELT